MITIKYTLLSVALTLSAVAPALANVGSVILVRDGGTDIKRSHHQVPAVGAFLEENTEIRYGPKVAKHNQTRRAEHVLVVAQHEDGRARTEVIDRSILAGDNVIRDDAGFGRSPCDAASKRASRRTGDAIATTRNHRERRGTERVLAALHAFRGRLVRARLSS